MCCTEKTQFPSRIREWVEIIDNSQKYRVFLWSICLLSIISRKEIRNGRHKDWARLLADPDVRHGHFIADGTTQLPKRLAHW